RLRIVARELFPAVAALQRPSWGHWNGLITALRSVRRRFLSGGTAAERDAVRAAANLNQVLDTFEAEASDDEFQAAEALADFTRTKLPRRPRHEFLLTLPITLRNQV